MSIRDKLGSNASHESPNAIIPSIKLSRLFASPTNSGFSASDLDHEKSSKIQEKNDHENTQTATTRAQSNSNTKSTSMLSLSTSAFSWQSFCNHMEELHSSHTNKQHELEVEKGLLDESRLAIVTEHARYVTEIIELLLNYIILLRVEYFKRIYIQVL